MGYRKQKTILNLKFEDHPGLKVRLRAFKVDELLTLTKTAQTVMGPDGKVNASAVGTEDLEFLFGKFADALLFWNLEEDVSPTEDNEDWQPVPPTLTGVKSQEIDFVMELVDVWMTAVAGVEAPLPEGSNSGETSQELSLPMEAL